MEVSSHALALHRVDAIHFDVAVFTNLGLDHLDFHETPEAYFAAKARLFDRDARDLGLVNVDDVHGRLLRDAVDGPMQRLFARRRDRPGVQRPTARRSSGADSTVRLPLPGRHNVSNALAAAEACPPPGRR